MKNTMAFLALLASSFSVQAGFTPEDSSWEFTFVSSNFYKVEYEILEKENHYADPQEFSTDQNVTLKYNFKGSDPFATTVDTENMAMWINGISVTHHPYYMNFSATLNFFELDSSGIPTDWSFDIKFTEWWFIYDKDYHLTLTPTEIKFTLANKSWYSSTYHSAEAATGTWSAYYHPGIAAVPEPSSDALLLVGLGLIGWATRRKRQNSIMNF